MFRVNNLKDFSTQRSRRRFKTRKTKPRLTAAQKRALKVKKKKSPMIAHKP
jgi:hypothetical protein